MNLLTLPIEAKREALALLEAKAELRRRRQAEEERQRVLHSAEAIRGRCQSLAGFVREAWPVLEPDTDYVHNWHIDAICAHLEAVTRGEINRLLINVPPGSMKSLLVSVFWPAWEWGPAGKRSMRYLTTSFAEDTAKRDARKHRDLVMSDWFKALWPDVRLVRAGEMSFANDATGWRECSAFGSLTSKRGNRLIIDDPHSTDTAESDQERATTARRFREGATNRLNNQRRDAIVVVMQRLHEEDVSGTIKRIGMGYVHLCLPMEYDPERHCETPWYEDPRRQEGELLDPDRFPPSTVEDLKRDMGPYAYVGQYQQLPGPRDGAFFMKAWFDGGVVETPLGSRTYARARYQPGQQPKHLRVYLTSDHAPTAGPKSDSNGVRVWGVDPDGDLWMLGGQKGKMRLDQLAELIIGNVRDFKRPSDQPVVSGLLRDWQPFAWFPEGDNNYKAVEGFIIKRMREEGVHCRIEPISPNGQDKATRAQAAQAMAAMGRIHFPEGQEGDEAIQELIGFPAAAHDEEVDLLAVICRAIDTAHPAIVPPEEAKAPGPPKGINDMTMNQLLEMQAPKRDRV
jgi:predicted phage terminase large subunit-like protein